MPGYYKINHSWADGRRHTDDDVLLEAVITSYADINISETLARWLKDKPKSTTDIDYKNTICWYCGGVWLHYITLHYITLHYEQKHSVFIYALKR